MKTSTTFSILIWINASRAKNYEAEIFARITVNQKRANISLKRKVNIDSWDKTKSRAKGNSQKVRLLNQYLEQVKAKLVHTHQVLSNQNKLITSKLIKSSFLGEDEAHKSLNEIITYHSNKIKNKFGKAAGPIRNKQMAEYADALICFWDGKSRGTKNMIKLANKRKLNVLICHY